MSEEATQEQLQEQWARVEAYWEAMGDKIDYPWTHAATCLSIFQVTLRQRGLRIPDALGRAAVGR